MIYLALHVLLKDPNLSPNHLKKKITKHKCPYNRPLMIRSFCPGNLHAFEKHVPKEQFDHNSVTRLEGLSLIKATEQAQT
ncbi:hypothetical protein BpHYR1_018230 [Brachionus plicatilis]|uniref:Uncharacterized protein n=1 Tax=Brachionus plicatilis TaxID=10195 RepID=A0A3M7QW84_BRAPC|nr:hypothetical protein BpHYR1_018230 [Brachionus plicatilis]